MIHVILWLVIGSAVGYLMKPQIQILAKRITKISWLQAVIEILLDALISVTWLFTGPILLVINHRLKQKEEPHEKTIGTGPDKL